MIEYYKNILINSWKSFVESSYLDIKNFAKKKWLKDKLENIIDSFKTRGRDYEV